MWSTLHNREDDLPSQLSPVLAQLGLLQSLVINLHWTVVGQWNHAVFGESGTLACQPESSLDEQVHVDLRFLQEPWIALEKMASAHVSVAGATIAAHNFDEEFEGESLVSAAI